MSAPADHRVLLARALQAVDGAQRRIAALEADRRAPVAIIGWACRLPRRVDHPEAAWSLFAEGRTAIGSPPADRPGLTQLGGWIEELFSFDAAFFGMDEDEAAILDPQQRLTLEVSRAALEDAHLPARPGGGLNAGVWVAASTHDFALELTRRVDAPRIGPTLGLSGGHAAIPGRISRAFGLVGPSVAVDAACASGLVGLDAALRALRSGLCDYALVAGVSVMLGPHLARSFDAVGLCSPDGMTRPFSAEAAGYGRAEGAMALVLCRADRPGHRERARVLGSALRHAGGGATMGSPSGEAQAAVIRAALADAGLRPEDVGFVEAHATATPVGDLIELETLGEIYGDPDRPLPLSSAKGHLGHAEAAAGLVGVLKAALQLREGLVAPLPGEGAPSNLDMGRLGLRVARRLERARAPIGGVSAFGVTGTHAHVLLSRGRPHEPGQPLPGPPVLALSAPDPHRLALLAREWEGILAGLDPDALPGMLRAAAMGRTSFSERLALVGGSPEELGRALSRWRREGSAPGVWRGRASVTAPPGPVGPAAAVAAAWVKGGAVDWKLVLGEGPPADIPFGPRIPVTLGLDRLGPQVTLLDGADRVAAAPAVAPRAPAAARPRREAASPEARRWEAELSAALAPLAGRDGLGSELTLDTPFADLGVDSQRLVSLRAELERELGRAVPITLLLEHPTIRSLAGALAGVATPPMRALPPTRPAVPIAVVGLACRFPGANDARGFWRLLVEGRDTIGPVPADRWDVARWYHPDAPGRVRTQLGGFLDDVHSFDARFFGITPREAEAMDPQQRLLLEVSWTALEHARIPADGLAGSDTGVFVGIASSDFASSPRAPERYDGALATGVAHSIAANRLSYLLDLRGPSLAVDTACSSSLVAVHLACQALAAGECGLALAGGVNVMLAVEPTIAFSQAGMLAPDGRCRTFDAEASGYSRGEGCGMVVLARLDDALARGDRILAVIRGSAVNQDGRTQGLTAPSLGAQVEVVRRALARAGVSPADLQWVETHGTGTPLGDPIEVEALRRALRGVEGHGVEGRGVEGPVALGAVKTNLGHLEAAAGVAGLIKAVLAMEGGIIPPNLHFRRLNPHIDLGPAFVVPTEPRPWTGPGRHVGVSAFGFGGTNAHVILGEPPPPPGVEGPRSYEPVVVLSARSEPALARMAAELAEDLPNTPEGWRALSDSSVLGRASLPHRLMWAGRGPLGPLLRALARGERPIGLGLGRVRSGGRPQVAFVCPGQGGLPPRLELEIKERSPVFAAAFERCREILASRMDLAAVLESGALSDTRFAQPALVALAFCHAELLGSLGVEPAALIGHSVGEIAAWTLAGALSLEEALSFAAERGLIMAEGMPPGAMGVCHGERPLPAGVVVAARNAADRLVVAGSAEAIAGVVDRVLPVDRAFHTSDVEGCLGALTEAAGKMRPRPARIPVATNTGGVLGSAPPDAQGWARHARRTVDFGAGIEALVGHGIDAFVELGPGGLAELVGRSAGRVSFPLWSRRQAAGGLLAEALAGLWVAGVPVRWEGRARPSELPFTPFARPEPVEPVEEIGALDFVDVVG